MLHAHDIRDFLYEAAPRDRWLALADIYALVESRHDLDSEDLRPVSDRHPQPRWKRNVRAVLQDIKNRDVEWERPAKYRFPSQADELGRGEIDAAALADELIGLEGAKRARLVVHRAREKRLRARKIEQARRSGGGRLRCEVDRCGFDFQAVYGYLGRDYAQVHHLLPLSDRDDAAPTSLADLAVVCANCHAMIHLGGDNRPLATLIPVR